MCYRDGVSASYLGHIYCTIHGAESQEKMGISAPFLISIKILRLGRKRDGYKEKNNEIKKRRNP